MTRPDPRITAQLPVRKIAEQVNETLRHSTSLVVTAPPGAGKSTLLPLTILEGLPEGSRILMLEPRRLAARQIAERMSALLHEPVGQTVGYRIRFESKISARTRIEVLTEGILTRMLIDDPMLEDVSVVIFDEFHERSLTSDVALALTREAQQVIRPDLRIVLMSATIDASSLCQQLQAPLIESEGRMFPIETRYAPIVYDGFSSLCEEVVHVIRKAHHEDEGDLLVFLPGEAEIRQCAQLLEGTLGSTRICPLYGMLSPKEQQTSIAPSGPGERKVVLATPIAETSLTIEGVRVVIDSGLYRKMVFDSQSGLSHLETMQISMDMANQRRGRAGRVAAGVCYRLWSLATEHRMEENRQPELLEADLAPMLLDVAAWGESHAERLPWLTPPPPAHLAQGAHLLRMLEAIDDHGCITRHGRKLAALPCHPRIGQMLISAESPTHKAWAADIAALLEERTTETNINDRIVTLRELRGRGRSNRSFDRILRTAEQYRHMMHVEEDNTILPETDTGRLLAAAYPERIAHALPEGCGRYRLSNGDTVQVEHTDPLSAHDWLVAAHLNGQHIFLASPVSVSDLRAYCHKQINVSWDNKNGQLISRQEQRLGRLLVDSRPLSSNGKEGIEQAELRQLQLDALCLAAHKEGQSMFDFNDAVGNLQRRIAVVASWHPELSLPEFSTDSILLHTEDWLPPFLEGNKIPTSVNELKKIDLTTALWSMLDYSQQQAIERLAPNHITVPTGSRIRIEYRQGAELPIVRVRLQECFGLTDTPRVDAGRRPILMELLSPGFKPVQLTQDLHSFWEGTYFEVRKELRRRYPKHAWPDNPLTADPTRGVKRSR